MLPPGAVLGGLVSEVCGGRGSPSLSGSLARAQVLAMLASSVLGSPALLLTGFVPGEGGRGTAG